MRWQVNVGEIIYETLIAGDSYKTLLKGLSVTLQISLLSVLLGTLLGMVICALRKSRFWIVRNIFAGYIAIVRGSPVVLLLMLMDDFRFSGRRWKNAVGYSGLKKAPYYQAAVSSILGETTISSLFRCGKAKRNKQVLNLSEKTAKPKWRGKDSVTVKHWPAPACLTIVEHCEDLKFTTIRACWYKRTEIQ